MIQRSREAPNANSSSASARPITLPSGLDGVLINSARVEAFGYGEVIEIPSAAAVDAARAATPAAPSGVADGEPNGLRAGERVSVVHESFGLDPTVGELVSASVHEIAVRRTDERAGEVVVHFPREHYFVTRG